MRNCYDTYTFFIRTFPNARFKLISFSFIIKISFNQIFYSRVLQSFYTNLIELSLYFRTLKDNKDRV